jgi:hypothetical protein
MRDRVQGSGVPFERRAERWCRGETHPGGRDIGIGSLTAFYARPSLRARSHRGCRFEPRTLAFCRSLEDLGRVYHCRGGAAGSKQAAVQMVRMPNGLRRGRTEMNLDGQKLWIQGGSESSPIREELSDYCRDRLVLITSRGIRGGENSWATQDL